MKQKLTALERVVGVFVLITILMIIVAVIMVNKWWESFEEYNYYTVEFRSKTGLAVDQSVNLLGPGWEIGRVVGFSLNERNGVDVTVKINKKYCNRIREDSVASVSSFFGAGGTINITIGHVPEILENNRKIPSADFPEGKAILQKQEYKKVEVAPLDKILLDVSKLTTMLTDEHGEVRSILRNVEGITRQIRYGEGLIPSLYNSKSFYNKVGSLLNNLDQILVDVDDVVLIQNENINKLLQEDVQRLLTKIEQNLDIYTQEAYAILDNVRIMVNNITGIINNLVRESGQKVQILLNALSNQALRTLNDMTTLLNSILRDIALNTDPMLRNIVNQVFNTTNDIALKINQLIGKVSSDVVQITHNLVVMSDQLSVLMEELSRNVDKIMEGIDGVLVDVHQVMRQVESFIGGSGQAGQGGLKNIPRMQNSERLVPE